MNRREIESTGEQFEQLFAIVSNAASGATQREGGTEDNWESDFAAEIETVFQVIDQRRLRYVEANLGHRIFEEQPVFAFLDRVQLCTDKLRAVFFEDAVISKSNSEVKSCLPTHRRQNRECAGISVGGQHL